MKQQHVLVHVLYMGMNYCNAFGHRTAVSLIYSNLN